MCKPSRIVCPGNRKIPPSSKTPLHTIIKLGLLKKGYSKLILTEHPSPWLHFIPVVEHIDTHSKADELSGATSSSQIKPHIRCPLSLIPYSLLVLLLHFKFLAQLWDNMLSSSRFCLELLLISHDWRLESLIKFVFCDFATSCSLLFDCGNESRVIVAQY